MMKTGSVDSLQHHSSKSVRPTALHFRPVSLAIAFLIGLGSLPLQAADAAKTDDAKKAVSIFPDKALEKAVRHQVFSKRDNDEPITAEDVADVAIIDGSGFGIKDLTGLEFCKKVALINLANNQITDVDPLAGLNRLQSLDLSKNQIESIEPLATNTALQYLDVSFNNVKKLNPITGLTNMATLLVAHNEVSDIAPVFGLPKLHSLHVDGNRIKKLDGIGELKRLDLFGAGSNRISDLTPLEGLTDLRMVLLEDNRLTDLQPLVDMAGKDAKGDRRFAPFLQLYLKGNDLSSKRAEDQLEKLRGFGVRVHLEQ